MRVGARRVGQDRARLPCLAGSDGLFGTCCPAHALPARGTPAAMTGTARRQHVSITLGTTARVAGWSTSAPLLVRQPAC